MALLAMAIVAVVFWLLVAYCFGDWWWVWFGAKFMGVLLLLWLFGFVLEEWRRRWAFMNSRIASKVLREVK